MLLLLKAKVTLPSVEVTLLSAVKPARSPRKRSQAICTNFLKFGILLEKQSLTSGVLRPYWKNPPRPRPGRPALRRVIKSFAGPGAFSKAAWPTSAEVGTPPRPRSLRADPSKRAAIVRARSLTYSFISTARGCELRAEWNPVRLPRPTCRRGGSLAGVPNIYLIYWARLTDSPPSALDNMTVRFVWAGDDSYYSLPSDFTKRYCVWHKDLAPYGVKIAYGCDTEMFSFLDSVISPSCLERVVTTMDNSECYLSLIFNVDHVTDEDIEKLLIPLDDLPF